jgi:hypothetical protein
MEPTSSSAIIERAMPERSLPTRLAILNSNTEATPRGALKVATTVGNWSNPLLTMPCVPPPIVVVVEMAPEMTMGDPVVSYRRTPEPLVLALLPPEMLSAVPVTATRVTVMSSAVSARKANVALTWTVPEATGVSRAAARMTGTPLTSVRSLGVTAAIVYAAVGVMLARGPVGPVGPVPPEPAGPVGP